MKRKGFLFIFCSAISFSIMGVFIKLLSNSFNAVTLAFIRSVIGAVFAFLLAFPMKYSLKGNNYKFLFLRGLFGTIALFTFYSSIIILGLNTGTMACYSYPLFTILFSKIFLKEKWKKGSIYFVLSAFAGIFLILKPDYNVPIIGIAFGIIAAITAGAAITAVRFLRKTDAPGTIVFYFAVFASIACFPFTDINSNILNLKIILYLAGMGIFATLAQFLLTFGYKYAPASEGSTVSILAVADTVILSFIIFNDLPSITSFIGTIIVFASIYFLININRKNR